MGRNISDAELNRLKIRGAPRQAFYVWGIVTYEDIFGKARRTEFCNLADYDSAGNPLSRPAPLHNQAD
jgi:hypothetical protein